MPEEINLNQPSEETPESPEINTEIPEPQSISEVEEPQIFDLADDLLQLEKINLMRAVMIRIQGGRHPNREIDALLKRRIDITADNHEIHGPYVIRLICTVMMIFVMSSLFWIFLWLLAASFEFNYFAKLFSTGVATVFAAAVGIAVFHPSATPDEKLVKKLINQNLELIRKELEESNRKNNADSSDTPETEEKQKNSFEEASENTYKAGSDSGMPNETHTMSEEEKKLALEGSDDFAT